MNIPNVIYQWVFSKALASGRSEHQQGIWKVALLWYHTSFTMISYISYPLCWNISKASGRLRYYDIALVSLWYHTHDIIHIYSGCVLRDRRCMYWHVLVLWSQSHFISHQAQSALWHQWVSAPRRSSSFNNDLSIRIPNKTLELERTWYEHQKNRLLKITIMHRIKLCRTQ